MRARTQYDTRTRRLTVRMRRDAVLPSALIGMLLEEGLIEKMEVEDGWRSKGLVVTLAERDNLLPLNLLCRLAQRLSEIPGMRCVYDPWTIGGREVNVLLAVELVGNVFRRDPGLCPAR